jgi:hypothetical protein
LTVKDEAAESTVDLQVVVSRSSSGFFGVLDAAGGDDPAVVLGLGAVLLILLTVLGIGMLRKEDDSSDVGWQGDVALAGGADGSPSAAPPTYAFQQQTQSGPPIPAEGLPAGWTTDQWSWYGERWLAENNGGAGAAGGAGGAGGGKSRAGDVLVTAAEPVGFAEPISNQQAANVFDVGYFSPADEVALGIPTSELASTGAATAVTAAAVLMPVESSQPPQTQPEVSGTVDSATESESDPFGALDFDL